MAEYKTISTYQTDLSGRNDLGSVHINNYLQDYEQARSTFFQFEVEGLDQLVKASFSLEEPEDDDLITNGGDVIRLSVDTVSVPHYNVSDIPIERGNSVVHFAGKPTWEEGSLSCKDFVGLHTKDVLMAWQRLTYDPITDKGGRAGNWIDDDGNTHLGYKRKCFLKEYTQDFELIRTWELIGVFPTSVTEGAFDKTKDDFRMIDVKFVYDRAILKDKNA